MTDDQPSGSCPTCNRRDPRTPQLCDVCRSRLRSWVFDIPALHAELEERISEGVKPSDVRVAATVTEWDADAKRAVRVPATVARPADPAAHHLPSGASSSASRGGPVSGSKERRLPIDPDAVDLTGPARSAGVAILDEDAVGYESVASVLDRWVEDWRAYRGAGERRPSATVPELTRWLLDRLDDAMDVNPAVAEFYDAVRRLRGALQAQLGLIEVPDYKQGVPCPRCQALTLVQRSGSDRVECGTCPALLSFIEYDEHVRALSAEQVQARRVKVAQIKAARALLVGLRATGWQRGARFEDVNGQPTQDRAERDCTVLTWWRDRARIEVWVAAGQRAAHGSVYYTPDELRDGMFMAVHVDWVAEHGFGALTKVARAAGILTPVKQKETAA